MVIGEHEVSLSNGNSDKVDAKLESILNSQLDTLKHIMIAKGEHPRGPMKQKFDEFKDQ